MIRRAKWMELMTPLEKECLRGYETRHQEIESEVWKLRRDVLWRVAYEQKEAERAAHSKAPWDAGRKADLASG